MEKWRQDLASIGYPVEDGCITYNGARFEVSESQKIEGWIKIGIHARTKSGYKYIKPVHVNPEMLPDKDYIEYNINDTINQIKSME